MDEAELNRIRVVKKKVEADLLKRPGVTGVDIGRKIVGGQKTDQLCIRVYVENKADITGDEAIPREIEGIPTDVIERRFILHGADGPD